VQLAGLGGMMRGMGMMTVRDMGVMRRLFDIVAAMLRGGVAMMFRGLFVMLGGALVMLGDAFFRHLGSSPSRAGLPVTTGIGPSRCNPDAIH
jgi:hypothetical protein